MFVATQPDVSKSKIQHLWSKPGVFLTRSQVNDLNLKRVFFGNKELTILNEALGQFVAENYIFFICFNKT